MGGLQGTCRSATSHRPLEQDPPQEPLPTAQETPPAAQEPLSARAGDVARPPTAQEPPPALAGAVARDSIWEADGEGATG